LLALNETLINLFGKGSDGKARFSTNFSTNNNRCQLCHLEKHMASTCPKLIDIRPKCAKCGGGHKIKNYSLNHSFCFGQGQTKNRCWKKSTNGHTTTTNFLEVLVNDEEGTLSELNNICGKEEHVFFRIRMPNKILLMFVSMVEV